MTALAEERTLPDMEQPLLEAAKRYLKERYGEDTISMAVTANGVEEGDGVLAADCTVRFRSVAAGRAVALSRSVRAARAATRSGPR